MVAVETNEFEMVELFVEYGADIDVVDRVS
jgi:hypothetical protein